MIFRVVKFSWSGIIHENILTAMSKKHGASTRTLVDSGEATNVVRTSREPRVRAITRHTKRCSKQVI